MGECRVVSGIDYDLVSNYLYYDETSPTGLRWKKLVSPGRKKIGDVAGSIAKGYSEVVVDGCRYLSHRVVMCLHKFDVQDLFVDHIDGNIHNNVVGNLLLVTAAGNQRNQKVSSRNSTGISGVTRISLLNGSKTKLNYYYQATYYDSVGNYYKKKFSIDKHGEELAKSMAIEFRLQVINKLNEEYINLNSFGYTGRHYNETTTSN